MTPLFWLCTTTWPCLAKEKNFNLTLAHAPVPPDGRTVGLQGIPRLHYYVCLCVWASAREIERERICMDEGWALPLGLLMCYWSPEVENESTPKVGLTILKLGAVIRELVRYGLRLLTLIYFRIHRRNSGSEAILSHRAFFSFVISDLIVRLSLILKKSVEENELLGFAQTDLELW